MAISSEVSENLSAQEALSEIIEYVNSWYTWQTGRPAPPQAGDPNYFEYYRALNGYIARLNE
jgi:hypothetical protein